MKKLLILMVMLLGMTLLMSQAAEYTFVQSSETYTEITGGTVVATGLIDDTQYAITPAFGFNFNFVPVTAMAMSSNGYLSFNAGITTFSYNAISSTAVGTGVVAPLSRDLRGGTTGEMRWEVFGTAPDRYAIYQWKNWRDYGGSADNSWNFQVILYETSNNIAIRYGSFTWVDTNTNVYQVGLRGATNADFKNRTTTTDWSATVGGTINSATCTVSTTVYPASGLQFAFNYPMATGVPNPAILSAPANGGITFTNTVMSWISGGGLPDGYDVYLDTVNPPLTLVSNNQTGNTYTPTLASGTTYYWQVVPYNSFGDAENCPVWSFYTPTSTQVAESFEATTFPPAGWANPGTWSRSTSYFKHGVASAYKFGSASTQYVLSTPRVTIVEGSTLNLWSLVSGATGTLQIVYSPDRVTWTQIGANITHAATYTMYNSVIDLSSLAGNNYYLGIRTGLQGVSFYIDAVFGPEITPEAPGPVALSLPADLAINVNEYATFTWTAPTTGGVPTGYRVYVDTVNPPLTQVANVTGLTYTMTTPLAYNTTYYWTVESYNGAGNGTMPTPRSFTTRANPTISTFPWLVNFGTLAGDWPVLNWTQLINQYGTTLAAGTRWYQDDFVNVTTPLNKAAKMNVWSANYGWLVTPPVAIPADGYELKFDLGLTAYSSTSAVTAGGQPDDKFMVIIADNPNMANPTILREWNNTGSPYVYDAIPNTGMNVSFDLTGFSGTKYFAFYGESSVSNGDNDLFVDNVQVREIPALPIFSYTPTSINFGTVMQNVTAGPFNVTITNIGGSTLNIAAGDVSIIGADAGQFSYSAANLPAALTAGQSVIIPVTMYATSEGAKTATLRIVNNQGRTDYDVALSGTALPEGIVVIGNGNTNLNLPIHPYFGYTYSQTIYLQSELNMADQRIEKIWYYWNGFEYADVSDEWVIYMGHTANTAFADGNSWLPLANLTQVFSGQVITSTTAGWVEIVLDNPFIYNNTDNLVIAVEENEAGYDSSSSYFFSTAAATNRSLRYYSDSINPDPAAPPAGTPVLGYPNTMLLFGDLPLMPILTLNPTSWDFGMIPANLTNSKVFTVSNTGAGSLDISDISITGTYYSLTSVPTLPLSLLTGQSATFTVQYAPLAAGTHIGNVTITDGRAITNVPLTGQAYMPSILPLSEGFETGFGDWIVVNGTQTNKWYVGTATAHNGTQSAYISNDGGVTHAYTDNVSSVVHMYQDIYFTQNSVDFQLNFWWLANAEAGWDYLKVYLVDTTVTPTAGVLLGAGQIGLNEYNGVTTWTEAATITLPGTHSGTVKRLVFTWRNDTSVGNMPPAAIDDISLTATLDIQDRPDAPILVAPADLATDLPIGGIQFSWTRGVGGGTPAGYWFSMADDPERLFSEEDSFMAELTGTTITPVYAYDYLTTYYWAVYAYNAFGNSEFSDIYSFTTRDVPSGITTFPWDEDFENPTFPPDEWTVVDVDGAGTFWQNTPAYNHTPGGTNAALHVYSTVVPEPGQNGWLITPPVTLPVGLNMVLSWWNYNVYPTWMVYNGVKVNTVADPAAPGWVELWTATSPGSAWSNAAVNISAYGGQTVYFAFNYQGYDGDNWMVDDVSIFELTVDTTPPTITHLPVLNTPREDISYLVYADIVDDATWNNPIGGANVYYSVNGGAFTSIPMTLDRDGYYAFIPAQALDSEVDYYIQAWDILNNTATSSTYTFYVEDPTWIWYDQGGTGWTWFGAGQAFSPMNVFENPFYGTGNAVQVNAVDGAAYDVAATTQVLATLHVYSWDGVSDLALANFVDLTGPVPVTFQHLVYRTVDLTAYNIQVTDPYFIVLYELPVSAAFLFDNTYDYGMTFAVIGGVIYSLSNPGMWAIGANVGTGMSMALDTPEVTISQTGGVVSLSWDAITGASSYMVFASDDAYAADPWTMLASTNQLTYTYGGIEAYKFFKVVASSEAPPIRATLRTAPLTLSNNAIRAIQTIKAPVTGLRK